MANRLGTNDPIYDASRLNTINLVNGQVPAVVNAITALTGDVTATGPGSVVATLKNTGPGATGPIGSATVAPVVTIDAQGRVTALSSATISGVSPVGAALTRGSIYRGSAAGVVEALALGGISGSVITRDATNTLWSTYALAGTAAQTYTFPGASATLAQLGANTFTAEQTITGAGIQLDNNQYVKGKLVAGTVVNMLGLNINNDLIFTGMNSVQYYDTPATLLRTTGSGVVQLSLWQNNGGAHAWYEVLEDGGNFNLRGDSASRKFVLTQNGMALFGSGVNTPAAQLEARCYGDVVGLLVTGYTTQAVATPLVKFTRNDAAAGVSAMLGLTALGSGSNGDGGSILMSGKSSTTAAQSMAALKWLWATATHASRKAQIVGTLYDTAERTWLQVDTDGSKSSVQINSLHYGSMYADDITQVVTIGSSGAYVKVPGSMTVGLCNGFTLASSRELTCTIAGTYKVAWSMSVYSGSNNEIIGGAAMVNTTEAHQTENASECINSGKPVSISGHGEITLAVNDVVALCVENETAAHDITVTHANLSVVRIGA